ncbi:hypothetical protein BC833DRAFT_621252 [Globomyces pollinis-pini]|nr:hypothetical protein BC833DRAFT_621252 [Globomyces pollinis-pini]
MKSNSFSSIYIDQFIGNGPNWILTFGCISVIYAYSISNKVFLWKVLLVHGISGFLGLLIQNFYIAKQGCCKVESWQILIFLNELNWITHETSTVVYSLSKLEVVITEGVYRKYLKYFLLVLWSFYGCARGYIGYLRFVNNTLNNPAIDAAHSYAYLIWGFTDIVIFVLLIISTYRHFTRSKQTTFNLILTLLESSIFRLSIMILNTLMIAILYQVQNPQSLTWVSFSNLGWAIKGAYPFILLIDMHTTKDRLIMAKESNQNLLRRWTTKSEQSTYNGNGGYKKYEQNMENNITISGPMINDIPNAYSPTSVGSPNTRFQSTFDSSRLGQTQLDSYRQPTVNSIRQSNFYSSGVGNPGLESQYPSITPIKWDQSMPRMTTSATSGSTF